MKALKKLTAIVLAVCMLIGMPLSIDVSAVKSSSDVTELNLLQVMPYIADPRYADVVPTNANDDPARFMFVIFNSITGNNSKAGSQILVVGSNGAIIRDENNKEVVLGGSFQGGLMPTGAYNKPLGWRLSANQSFSGKTINNFFDVKELLASEYYAQKGAKLVFRVWETTAEAADGKIADYYCDHNNNILLNGTDVLTIDGVKRDGLKKDVVWNPVTFTKAQALSDTVIRLSFSELIDQNNEKQNLYTAIRIVDTENNYKVVSNGEGEKYQYPWAKSWSFQSDELVWTSSKPISEIQAICDQLNADENTDKYKVMFCLEEKGDKLSVNHGEVVGNGYVDTLWGKSSGAPVSGTAMPEKNVWDGVLCEITPVDELKKANMTIESVTPIKREDMADRIAVTFSDSVNAIPVGSWIRVFDSTGKLLQHDKVTMKVIDAGDEGHLQWKIDSWVKAGAEGKTWVGQLNRGYGVNTYEDIVAYVSQITDADGKAVTPANGYKIQMAFLDEGTGKIRGNGLVDNLKSTDDKKLYAENIQSLGEERAVCDFSASLSVTDVSVYADKYVVLTFSDDIAMDADSLAKINANTIYLGAHADITKAANPVQDGAGHIHSMLSNARQFGNAGNKLVMDIEATSPWSSIKARIDALNTAVDLCVRIEGGGAAQAAIVNGFTSADGTLKLYRSNPNVASSGRHMLPVELVPYVTVEKVTGDAKNNALIVEFSDPVKYTDKSVVMTNQGSADYTSKRTQVSLQRFLTDSLTLDQTTAPDGKSYLYQPNATGQAAVDATGVAVTDEYSKYWAFYFAEGVVEAAMSYYADGNSVYSDAVGYGFGVYEGGGNIKDPAERLPLAGYMEDFATAPAADGSVKYLKTNSGNTRFFKEITVDDALVTVESAKLIARDTVQVTFSEPVAINGGENNAYGYTSIRVTEKNNLVGNNGTYQKRCTLEAVDSVDGYAKVWNLKATDLVKWAHDVYFNNDYSKTLDLCVSFQDNAGPKWDGVVCYVQNADGMGLPADEWFTGAEGVYISIKDDPYFATEIFESVEVMGTNDAMLTVKPIQDYTATKTWRIIDGATGVTKVFADGSEAIWGVTSFTNYKKLNTKMTVAGINPNFGVNTFDGIRGLMDGDDKLVLAFSDNRKNGVIDNFYLVSGGEYKMQKAHFSTDTGDVAYCEVVDNGKRALTVSGVSMYTRVIQTHAYQDEYMMIKFSEDIDMAKTLANIKGGNVFVEFSTKVVGEDSFWAASGGTFIKTAGAVAASTKVSASNFEQYGNSTDTLIAAVGGGALNTVRTKVAEINAAMGGQVAEMAIRIEVKGQNGQRGVNELIVPANAGTEGIFFDNTFGGGGRTYYSISEGPVIKIGSIHVVDAHHAEINFVNADGQPIDVTKQNYNPSGSVYTAIRLVKDGKLAYSNKGAITTDAVGSALQFDASMAPKNGPVADSTWVLTCNGVNLYDLMQAVHDENGYLRRNGVDMALGLEGGTVNGQMSDYIDNFTSTDGKAILQYTKDTNVAKEGRYFYAYLPTANTWTAADPIPETVKIEKVEAINNGVLQVTFDQAVNINTQGWTGLRIVDGVNNVIAFEDNKTTVMGNAMTVGNVNLGMMDTKFAKADEEGKVWNFTVTGGIHGHYGFVDILKFVESLPKTGEKWVGELKLALILEEDGDKAKAPDNVKNNGVTDRVYAVDGSGAKLVNDQMGKGIGDGTCIEIKADMLAKFDPANPLTVTSAKQINKKQLLVTFSEAVTIDNPYMAIRYVDENNELIYSKRDATGTTIKDDKTGGKPLQYDCTKWEWNNDTHTEIVVTFKHDIGVILDASNLPASLSPTTNPDYKFRFVIEETKPEESGEVGKSGSVCDVTAVANPSKMLVNSYKNFKKSGWDGHCAEITNVITPDTLITVSDAKITGENQVTFKWSHSVDLTNGKSYYAAFRWVNKDTHVLYGNNEDGWMQFDAYLNYTDSAMMEMTAHFRPNTKWGAFDLDDLLNPTGALKEYMDANPGMWIVRIEEINGSNGNAIIDTFFGKDGTSIQANPFVGSWADGVDINITGTPITGELSVTGVEIISDTQVKVTFSAPVAYAKNADGKSDSTPFVSLRLYNKDSKLLFWNPYTQEYTLDEPMKDKDGKQVYKNQNGYTLEKEGYNAEGEWVNYAAQNNPAMQWHGTPTWGDDKHTTIIYQLSGGQHLPIQNITDILNYDFSIFGEGAFIGFDIEENTPAMIIANGHVDNIVRADNKMIALDANFFPHSRDSVMFNLDNIKISYKPYKITSTSRIINETQIRISFSQPVEIEHAPFMAIRMIDKEGNLMWSGAENVSLPYQWSGTWEWENESHTSIIWTMTSTTLGASTIHDLANWAGVLQKYKNEGTWMFVIEELNSGDFKVGRYNNLVDNVVSKDGTVHLMSTYSKGLDGILTRLNVEDLIGPKVELHSAQALDDQTIKLTFSEAVTISENVSMGVRYLSASGDSDVLTDGKVAYFKGDWKYADENKNVIIWTLNTKNADSLTDIINYNGKFEWNKGSRVAFVIMDAEEERGTPKSMRINGINDLTGFRKLAGNYATKDYPMTQLDIEILYDIPAPEASGEQLSEVVYITNYIPFIIASAVIVLAGLVVAIILYKKRKKNEQ